MKIKATYLMLVIVLLVLLVFNLLLLHQNRKLRRNLARLSEEFELVSSSSPLLTAGSRPFCFTFVDPKTNEAFKPKLILLVFFSTKDCITCLQEVSIWDNLRKTYKTKGLKILGVVPSDDSLKMEEFTEAESLNLPIIYVDSLYIKQHIGITQTPFKVLLDSSLTVLYLNGPNYEIEDQQRFKNVIEKWCGLSL